jgi:hypothetical protein
MAAIRLTARIENDTLHIPELASLIGKEVEITIQEKAPEGIDPAWETFFANARPDTIDLDAVMQLREASMT